MSVYRQKDRKAWTYEFQFRGKTYKGNTEQLTREDAEAFELQLQQRVRRAAGGISDLRDAPTFQEWAGVYYEYKASSPRRVKRPDEIDFLLRTTLKFWGRRPKKADRVDPDAPYRDLTLADPILEPALLDEFEEWMEAQGFSGSHKNHLRTQVSGMYRVAMLPKFRKVSGITMNPMIGVPRNHHVARDVDLSREQLRAWMAHASYHVRLAMAIAALAPKLRLGNVLALEWREHLDRDLTRIRVADHKTDRSGKPLVVLIEEQLQGILKDARTRNPGRWVVAYRRRRVRSIRDGVKRAAERAGIVYGRGDDQGATFHTIRHAVATWFAEMDDLSEPQRAALLAHTDIRTTQGYTHSRPTRERKHLARLSAQTPLADIVTQPWRRYSARRKPLVPPMPREEAREGSRGESPQKRKKTPGNAGQRRGKGKP